MGTIPETVPSGPVDEAASASIQTEPDSTLAGEKEQQPESEVSPEDGSEPAMDEEAAALVIIGEVEPVTIVAADTAFPARIDTGATTSSLDARDIQSFERDGSPWVRFTLINRETGKELPLESKVVRKVKIKRHGAESSTRPVVRLKAIIGTKSMKVEFSLTERADFEYPVLVGRNILDGNFLVDVSRKNSTSPMREE